MKTTGATAQTLTNVFGGSINNEGLGLFTLSFDWQYITSFQTSLPLNLQAHQAAGFVICFAAMLGIYYTNVWDSQSLPFMSTSLKQANGTTYPSATVFPGGELDQAAFETYGIPRLTGTFAYSMLIANAAVSTLPVLLYIFPVLTIRLVDWCSYHPLLPLLGQRLCPGVQERKERSLHRPSPCSHGQALQGCATVVVFDRACGIICPRFDRGDHPEHHPASLGIYRGSALGNVHRSTGKSGLIRHRQP